MELFWIVLKSRKNNIETRIKLRMDKLYNLEKIIENQIQIHSKDGSKELVLIKIKEFN